jgi:hypothetical protein
LNNFSFQIGKQDARLPLRASRAHPPLAEDSSVKVLLELMDGQFDAERARAVLNGTQTAVEDHITLPEHARMM